MTDILPDSPLTGETKLEQQCWDSPDACRVGSHWRICRFINPLIDAPQFMVLYNTVYAGAKDTFREALKSVMQLTLKEDRYIK